MAQFRLNLQTRCNLELEEDRLGERLEVEVRVLARQVLTDSWQGLYFPSVSISTNA